MRALSTAVALIVALEHVGFLVLEMFLWTKPAGRRTFRTTPEFARESAALAANQGLYNGFLAAGLVWSVLHPDAGMRWQLQVFFLACVVVAGVYGAATVSRRILLVQAVPAAVGLALLFLGSGPVVSRG